MRKFFAFVIAILAILFAVNEAVAAQAKYFRSAKGLGENAASFDYDKWRFSIGKDKYSVNKNGDATKRTNRTSKQFRLKLEPDEWIETLYFADYKDDLLLAYGVNAGGEGASVVTKLDSQTLKPKWIADISDFNVSRGLIENSFAYLTARTFIGKLDLNNGKFVWSHQKDFGCDYFDKIYLRESSVFFREGIESGTRIVEVNKNSGEIVKVHSGFEQ